MLDRGTIRKGSHLLGLFAAAFLMVVSPRFSAADQAETEFRLATFSADVTPPLGHPLLGGTTTPPPAHAIDDPLFARGFVLLGGARPIVLVSVDWCEIRNDAFDRWRDALAEAAGTTRNHVMVTAIHQHDAPLADLEAQRILDASQQGGALIDPAYHEQCVERVGQALKAGLKCARRVTHFGVGQARVERIASNRRFLGADGAPRFDRTSMSGGDPVMSEAPEGKIDPWLKVLSFWDRDEPLLALHSYSVHPMSNWGSGRVTADFPGWARQRMQDAYPTVFQIYASGCSGDTTAGKYNDGGKIAQQELRTRLFEAMQQAWKSTRRQPLTRLDFSNATLSLPTRTSAGFTAEDLERQLESPDSKQRCLAALGLSWRKRVATGQPIDVPALDLGAAAVVLLPGESYVAFQLAAQRLRPNDFVMALGYGESAPGFVPIERAWLENDLNLAHWCWVDPGCEALTLSALEQALAPRVLKLQSEIRFPVGRAPPNEHATYAHPTGAEMLSYSARSLDHGRTWNPESSTPDFDGNLPKGYRRNSMPAFLDPVEDRLVRFVLALDTPGLNPNLVEPPIAEHEYYLRYRVSIDGGKTWLFDERVIQHGDYADRRPIEGVWLGKNGYYPGDVGSIPLRTRAGKLLVPVQVTHLDAQGEPASPGGGFTYQYTRMLIGTWTVGHKIAWEVSDKIEGDPDLSSRGLFEPTIAELPDGRVICVMRGSNGGERDPDFQWKSHKWFSESSDGGRTWSRARPWTYADGGEFHSPSAMSQLLSHSNGDLFWIGNIAGENCRGNDPRRPLVIGRVDPRSGALMKETLLSLDTLQPEDKGGLNLSHWRAYENRATGEIHLPMRRWNQAYTEFQGVEYIVRVRASSEG